MAPGEKQALIPSGLTRHLHQANFPAQRALQEEPVLKPGPGRWPSLLPMSPRGGKADGEAPGDSGAQSKEEKQ